MPFFSVIVALQDKISSLTHIYLLNNIFVNKEAMHALHLNGYRISSSPIE